MNKSILYVVLAIAVVAILAFVFRSYNPSKLDNDQAKLDNYEASESLPNNPSSSEPLVDETSIVKSGNLVNGEYLANSEVSSLTWEGRKTLIVDYKDAGIIKVKSGYMLVEEGTLKSGEMILDMTSLSTTSVGKGGTEGLDRHLRSADFFDVDNFQEAKINLIAVSPVLEGNEAGTKYSLETEITIKDVTNNVSIPVEMYMENDQLVIVGEKDLDRTLWGIRYGSDKFFDNLANNVIDDFFSVGFRFVFNIK